MGQPDMDNVQRRALQKAARAEKRMAAEDAADNKRRSAQESQDRADDYVRRIIKGKRGW